MTQQVPEEYICSMCEAEPEDILVLSCSHNLCLHCASQLVYLNLKQNQLTCEICLSQTPLDNQTINCLTAMSATEKNNIKRSKCTIPKHSVMHVYEQIQVTKHQDLPVCQLHGQEVIYFCFDCNCMNICSQCMLCDKHKGHQITTMKKATALIQQKMKDLSRQKLRLKNMMFKDMEQLSLKKQESQNQVHRQKQQLKEVFDRIVRIVSERYSQLNKQIEQAFIRHLQIIQGCITQISDKVNLIEETVHFQNQLMHNLSTKKQQMHLLQYYCQQLVYPVKLQPNLPNIINPISFSFDIKTEIIDQIQQICRLIQIKREQISEQNNINHMSVIQNENYNQRQKCLLSKKKGKLNSKNYQRAGLQDEMDNSLYSQHSNQNSRQYQNINVIVADKRKNKTFAPKNKKQSRIKYRDQQQVQDRKLQMSRSIINATNIINKIQQRTRRT